MRTLKPREVRRSVRRHTAEEPLCQPLGPLCPGKKLRCWVSCQLAHTVGPTLRLEGLQVLPEATQALTLQPWTRCPVSPYLSCWQVKTAGENSAHRKLLGAPGECVSRPVPASRGRPRAGRRSVLCRASSVLSRFCFLLPPGHLRCPQAQPSSAALATFSPGIFLGSRDSGVDTQGPWLC